LVLQPSCLARSERGIAADLDDTVIGHAEASFRLPPVDLRRPGGERRPAEDDHGPPYTVQVLPLLFLMNILGAFNWLAFTIIATYRAATGQPLTYPVTLRRPRVGSASRRASSA
jgi:hypothetical protein